MKRFFLGIICMGAGLALMYYSAHLANFFGKSERAESYLGSTRNGYLLFGFLFIIIGFLIWFGMITIG